jgi:hypothetical protein
LAGGMKEPARADQLSIRSRSSSKAALSQPRYPWRVYLVRYLKSCRTRRTTPRLRKAATEDSKCKVRCAQFAQVNEPMIAPENGSEHVAQKG